uniref:Ig-like domain-containing protein n=1 Tax=Poecilia formosa TaxID=48698 RepID=A0A087X475_POEFO
KNISAVPGQIVSLPCRLPNNKPAVFVKWTRPDLEPEYVLLFRDEQPDPENQHPSFRKRVELQDRRMEDGDVSLLLSNVTTNDTGTYECRVFQREATGRKRRTLTSDPIWTVFLDVAPPTENKEGRKEDGSRNKHVGLIVGAVLMVPLVTGFKHTIELKHLWVYIKSKTMIYSQHPQFSGRVQMDKDVLREGRIRLHVSRLRTEDSGLYLTCCLLQQVSDSRPLLNLHIEP